MARSWLFEGYTNTNPRAIQNFNWNCPSFRCLLAYLHQFSNWIFIDDCFFSWRFISISIFLSSILTWWFWQDRLMTRENKALHVLILSANISKWWQIRLKIRPSRALSPDDGWLTGEFCFSDCDDILLQLHTQFSAPENFTIMEFFHSLERILCLTSVMQIKF